MIYIVEGPDGAGKTTLANYLSKKLDSPIIHRNKPKSEEDKQNMMQTYIDSIHSNDSCIWDRCFYSEIVYGKIMRDASYISIEQMRTLEEMLAKKGAIIFYCTGTVDDLYKRAMERGEDYITTMVKFRQIHNEYDRLMHHTEHLIPVVEYRIYYNTGVIV